MECLLPGEFVDVEYRSLRADTHVALGGFLHAAQAGADAASHHVFERNAAGITLLSRQCGDRFIIGTGPQAATKSNCCVFHTEC